MKQPVFSSTSWSRIHRREGNSNTSNSSTKKKKEGREEQGNSSGSNNRNPFQDLSNGGSFTDVNSSIVTVGSSSSSVSSIEAPKGCLRFFLNHSAVSTSKPQVRNRNNGNHHRPVKVKSMPCKTPKSAPISRPSREKVKGIPSACLYKRQSGKNPKPIPGVSRLDTVRNPVSKLENSGSGDKGCIVEESNSTPLRLIVAGSGLDVTVDRCKKGSSLNSNSESSNTKTPPLHASISPEIQQQCQSSALSTAATKVATTATPVCYGAGHLLSGVTDKRKCRPRGLLVVGEAKSVDKFDVNDDHEADDAIIDGNGINLSPSNLPIMASMHWLLSPVEKDNECSSGNGGAQDLSKEHTERRMKRASVTSSDMEISPLEEKIAGCGGEDGSRFSMNLLCSVNLLQTPESDSGEKGKKYNQGWGFELDSVDQHWPASSSFQFNLPTTASHSVVDLSQFQNPLDIKESRLSISTFDDMSHSEVRISWRDGLVSRIFEMDELDCCCKCLSDGEEDEPLQTRELDLDIENSRTSDVCIETSSGGKHRVLDGKAKDGLLLPAESMNISRDGDALFQSDDSDWTQCYKNQLFKV